MGFDIVRTPTLQAVATEDESRLADDLQKRLDESISQAEAQPEVVQAMEAQRAAEERLGRLQKAERVLNRWAKESREQTAVIGEAALENIVESAAGGGRPDSGKLRDLAALENQNRYTLRAIQRVVEHWIPLAQIARLREESHALSIRARTVERIAQERAEKVLGQLRDAVNEEVVLPVDMSKGVAGALLAHAGGLKRHALQLADNADQIEKSYSKRREVASE
jgi:hypothetical protein